MTKDNGTAPDVFGRVFTLRDDLRQRDVATWNRAYLEHTPRVALADERQAALEAAMVAGWIITPECRYEDVIDGATGQKSRRFYFDGVEVGDLLASEVAYYGMLCSKRFDDAVAIPKLSSSP